jgi:peptide/nickel transport system ATP-binding protein
MTHESPLLEVRDLRVAYRTPAGDVAAVEHADLEVRSGEIVAIVGESGSGKSTLARAILHLLASNAVTSADRLRFGGLDLAGLSRSEWHRVRGAQLALVPQDPALSLDPLLPVGRQVAETLRIHRRAGKAEAHRRAVELLAEAGVDRPEVRARQLPSQLSGGLRQRALIAAAMAGDPKLLVADEPTSALDVTVQRQILDRLDELRRERGMAVLLITHDLGVAADRADRIVVMQQGRIVETGTPEAVLGNPEHEYTRRLVAAAPRLGRTVVRERRFIDAEQPPLLEVTDLHKRYRLGRQETLTAVGGVSLHIHRGETYALVGESGSGKTTTARVALQLEAASSGTVKFDGVDVTGVRGEAARQLHRRFQLVHQSPFASLDPVRTIGQTLAEPLREFGIVPKSQRNDRVAELLESVSLPVDFASRRPDQLSGGQRQRVAIARALATEPECIVLDEAVSALDVSVQAQVLELLARLQRETGVAYLFITHDLGVVRELADRVGVLRQGQMVETGYTSEVLDHPTADYTRALVEAIPGRDLARP